MASGVPGRERSAGTPEPRRHELIDFYELLEISPRASPDVIQAAYRALARNFHPDVNATREAGRRIRQLNAAYRVLSDAQDRAQYDLECLRARRVERRVQSGLTIGLKTALGAGRGPALQPGLAVGQQRYVDARFTLVHGVAVLGLLLALTLAAVLLVTLSSGDDGAAATYSSPYDRPTTRWPGPGFDDR